MLRLKNVEKEEKLRSLNLEARQVREYKREASQMKVLEKLCDVKRQHEIVKNIDHDRK